MKAHNNLCGKESRHFGEPASVKTSRGRTRNRLLLLVLIAATGVMPVMQSCDKEGSNGVSTAGIITTINGFRSGEGSADFADGGITSFRAGDMIGIFVISDDQHFQSNMPYSLTEDGKWEADEYPIEYVAGAEYIAYYPYSSIMNIAGSSDDIIAAFYPEQNQATAEAFRSSDLLIWSGKAAGNSGAWRLKIEFEHAMSLVEVDPREEKEHNALNDVKVNIRAAGVNHSAFPGGDNIWRAIVKPEGFAVVEVSYKYSGVDYGWDNTEDPIELEAGCFFWESAVGGGTPPDPSGYYGAAYGKSGEQLRIVLHEIIDDHTALSYKALWTAFRDTDKRPDGYVWDMYSDKPGGTPSYFYSFGGDQCGNYSGEGSCYNREHSFPKSWFNDSSPMYSDLFHLYPTDGYVNGRRGNYPFGEVSNPSWTSSNGSKVGSNTYSGYSGTVFEPIDEYKGDFARTYFYMVTRYMDKKLNYSPGDVVITYSNGKSDLKVWVKNMMVEWHTEDPVSQKETDRNNAVYEYQHNRNPYIDHPELVDHIWGSKTSTPFYPN